MSNSLLKWDLPHFIITPDHESYPIKISSIRKHEIGNYLFQMRPALILSVIIVIVSLLTIIFEEPDTKWYNIAIYSSVGVVGFRVVLMVLINLGYFAFRPNPASDISFEITTEAIICYKESVEIDRLPLSEIKRVQLKEVRYKKGSQWFVRIKNKNRRWHEYEIPSHLRDDIKIVFDKLSINYSISGKPKAGWYPSYLQIIAG